MAINLTTPLGEGYVAFQRGEPIEANPYRSINSIYAAYEWEDGWMRAAHG